MIEINQIVNTPITSNCYVIFDKAVGNLCLVVDPGSNDNSILCDFLCSENLIPQYIILTHEHFDHCWGVNDLRGRYRTVKLVCSSLCSVAIQNMKKNYSVFYEQPGFELEAAEIEIVQRCSLDWNTHKINLALAQGHSASGLLFTIGKYLFTGDELIKDTKTVTKLKTGSKEKLKESITLLKKMKGLGLIVCPGHGETFDLDEYKL